MASKQPAGAAPDKKPKMTKKVKPPKGQPKSQAQGIMKQMLGGGMDESC